MHRVDSQQTVQSFLLNCKQIVDDCVRLATNDGMRPDTVSACISRYVLRSHFNYFSLRTNNMLMHNAHYLMEYRHSSVCSHNDAGHTFILHSAYTSKASTTKIRLPTVRRRATVCLSRSWLQTLAGRLNRRRPACC
jgi:hypothetical protein